MFVVCSEDCFLPPGVWGRLLPPGVWGRLLPPGVWGRLLPPCVWGRLLPPGVWGRLCHLIVAHIGSSLLYYVYIFCQIEVIIGKGLLPMIYEGLDGV